MNSFLVRAYHLVTFSLIVGYIFVVFLSPSSFSADDNQPETERVSDRYERIFNEFKKKIAELQKQGVRDQRLAKLFRERDDLFAQLVEDNPVSTINDLSVNDLVSLAACCEYLKRRKECVVFCHAALKRDPNDQRIYFPLIRTLLNLDRLSEARRVLAEAQPRFSSNSSIRALHRFLYLKSKSKKHHAEAAMHISQYIEFYFAFLAESPRKSRLVSRHLDDFMDAHISAGEAEKARMDLKRYRNRVVARLEKPQQKQVGLTQENSTILAKSALYHLNCELTRFSVPRKFTAAISQWITFLWPNVAAEPSNTAVSTELFNSLKYLVIHSYAWDETTAQTVKQALSGLEERSQHGVKFARLSAIVNKLKNLDQLIHQNLKMKKLVGCVVPSLTELVRTDTERSVKHPPAPRVRLLHFWNPLISPGHQSMQALKDLRAKYSENILEILCVTTYTGFHWNVKRKKIETRENQDPESELASLKDYLSFYRIMLPCALMQNDSKLGELFESASYPLNVIVDRTGKVRFVESGVQKPMVRYLDEQIKILNQTSK